MVDVPGVDVRARLQQHVDHAARPREVQRRLAVPPALVRARWSIRQNPRKHVGTIEMRRRAGVRDRAGCEQSLGHCSGRSVEGMKTAGPPAALAIRVSPELQKDVDQLDVTAAGDRDERRGVERQHWLVDEPARLFVRFEEPAQAPCIRIAHFLLEPFDRGQLLDCHRIDMRLERRPIREAVLARQHVLRLRKTNLCFVRQLGADARACFGVATTVGREKLFGELPLLLHVRARGERSAKICRHQNLLRIGRRPHGGPKEVNTRRAVCYSGGRSPFRGPVASRTLSTERTAPGRRDKSAAVVGREV